MILTMKLETEKTYAEVSLEGPNIVAMAEKAGQALAQMQMQIYNHELANAEPAGKPS